MAAIKEIVWKTAPIALLLSGLLIGQANALECPVRQPNNPIGVDPTATKVIDLLKTATSANVPDIVGLLRSLYPNLQPADLVNHLIAAYCPILNARAAMPEAEKQQLWRHSPKRSPGLLSDLMSATDIDHSLYRGQNLHALSRPFHHPRFLNLSTLP